MRSVRAHLLTLTIVLVVLATAAFALLVYDAARASRSQVEDQLQETADLLSTAVDGELKGALGILSALAASEAVQGRDWAALDRQARAALSGRDAWLVVQDRNGRQMVNTGLPSGTNPPAGAPPRAMWDELASGNPRICNLVEGLVEQQIVCVAVPATDASGEDYALSIVLRPRFFDDVVNRQRVEEGHVAALLDRSGTLIWRNISPGKFVGKPATPDVRSAIRSSQRAVLESTTLDGVRTLAAFRRSRLSGWTVIVGTPLAATGAAMQGALWRGTFVAIGILLIGALLALLIARRVSTAVRQVGAAASSGFTDGRAVRSTGLRELDELQAALLNAAVARSESEQRLRESEERFRRIFKQTSDLVITADLQQVITDCNPSAAEAVGLTREEVIGRKISEFISPEDFERTTEALRQKLNKGGTTRYDVRVRSSTGEWLFWEINSGLTYDEEGRPIGLHVVGRDVTERKRWESHQRMLVGELNHRVKNTLAIVQSLSHQTFRAGTPPVQSIAAFEARLEALARAHNLLTRENWVSASMRDVIEQALAPFCSDERCKIDGPDVRVHPKTAVTLALAVHELATNASKYGGLSNEIGQVAVSWSVTDDTFELEWREQHGPSVVEPTTTGFGTRLIKRGLAKELGGTVDLVFEPSGVTCRVRAPLPAVDEL